MTLAERLPALKHREFRLYTTGNFVSLIGSVVQAWAISYHVYVLTNNSLYVGLLGLVRVVPLIVFSLVGGVVADQLDRRRVMLLTQSSMAIFALVLFLLTQAHAESLFLLYLLVALASIARALDGPSRQSLVVNLVPSHDLPNALSINGIAWRLSDVTGPVILGALVSVKSIAGMNSLALCYLLNFISFFAVIYAILKLHPRPPQVEESQRVKSFRQVISFIKDGLIFIRHAEVLRSAMWIDFWATLLSGAEALLPAFALKILNAGPQGYGILASSSATGALIAALVLAVSRTVVKQGRWVIWMIFSYGLCTALFGLAPNLWTACFFLACTGASDMVSTVLRQTIRQLATPDAMRGRMNATSSLFHISGPQLGDFEAGAVAARLGERASVVIGGLGAILVAAWWGRGGKLKDYEHQPIAKPEEAAAAAS